jgi:hypothetical protein
MNRHNIIFSSALGAAPSASALRTGWNKELESLVKADIVARPETYQMVEVNGQLVAVSAEEDTIVWIKPDGDAAIGRLSELRNHASTIPGLDVLIEHLDGVMAATEALNQLIELGIVEEETIGGEPTFRLTENGENIDAGRRPQQDTGTPDLQKVASKRLATKDKPKMSALHELLNSVTPDEVLDLPDFDTALVELWPKLKGAYQGGMRPHELLLRMEDPSWEPPYLRFVIERHGGTVLGSTQATLQHWEVNLDEMTAEIVKTGHRQLAP